jgi:hypothetical protein
MARIPSLLALACQRGHSHLIAVIFTVHG